VSGYLAALVCKDGGRKATIARAENEVERLQYRIEAPTRSTIDLEVLREELRSLRDRNLDEATFNEKLEIITRLGIKVYPSEDLKSMCVVCRLNLEQGHSVDRDGGIDSSEIQADGESE